MFATVTGKRLLPDRVAGRGNGPVKADADRAALVGDVGVKSAGAVFEGAHHGHVDGSGVASVEPPDGPGAGARVEGAQGRRTVQAIRVGEHIVVHIGRAP